MVLAKNRSAYFEYEISEKHTAGVKLKGYEVKAIREGKVNFDGSYVQILGNEALLLNMHIGRYSKQSRQPEENETRRTRKLLLNKNEIEKIRRALQTKGRTAIPLALILSKNLVKLEIGIGKGRKKYDKKNLEKQRQLQKDLERETEEVRRIYDI